LFSALIKHGCNHLDNQDVNKLILEKATIGERLKKMGKQVVWLCEGNFGTEIYIYSMGEGLPFSS
jgi:hypothetical protein